MADTVSQTVRFPDPFDKPLVATFDQQHASSDGGAVLLKAAERQYGLIDGFDRVSGRRPAARQGPAYRWRICVPPDRDVPLILDNYSTHKTPLIHRWLAKRPRFHLHFTPTYSSWLNDGGTPGSTELIRRSYCSAVGRDHGACGGCLAGRPSREFLEHQQCRRAKSSYRHGTKSCR